MGASDLRLSFADLRWRGLRTGESTTEKTICTEISSPWSGARSARRLATGGVRSVAAPAGGDLSVRHIESGRAHRLQT